MQPARADSVPPALRGSGLPVPRFVTIDADQANARSGPAWRYPIKYIYKKNGLPVEIIKEFDVWREIRDSNGQGGWVNKLLLSGKRGVIIKDAAAPVPMRDGSGPEARVVARLENGVIAKLRQCTQTACQISTGGYEGWVQRKSLWGLYPQEEIH